MILLRRAAMLGLLAVLSLQSKQDSERGSYDLTLVGQIRYSGSLDRLPISLCSLLKDELSINHIRTVGAYDFTDVSPDVAAILKNDDKTPGRVALIFEELVNGDNNKMPWECIPQECPIKIAYSLLESTIVPACWVEVLNSKFDLVVVADEFYRSVYKNSGVNIPIYVVPHGADIDDYLSEPVRTSPGEPFTFGCIGAFWPRKNQALLVDAFNAEFGNDPRVQLLLHTRLDNGNGYQEEVEEKIKHYANPSIKLSYNALSPEEFKKLFKSLDCYVILSKGEGFSLTPREALALGKPCIITDNTAHKTICKTGHVYGVPSLIERPAFEPGMGDIGVNFDSTQEDVQKALREVYEHYNDYLKRAVEGRKWVERYCWKNLKAAFLNLIKPERILLGDENVITDDFFMTNSPALYKKYRAVCGKSTADDTPVNFEVSMGKETAYCGPHYDRFITDIGSFSRFIDPTSSTELLHMCRNSYKQHMSASSLVGDRKKIPHTVHQIWVGKKPFPEKYKQWQKSWQSIPGWSYKLWTDADVETFDFATKEAYYKEKNMGARADILRIEILYQFGGLYVDTDFELVDSGALEKLMDSVDFFAGITPLDCGNFLVANGIIGSVPHHPLLEACSKNLGVDIAGASNFGFGDAIVNRGPGLLTRMISLYANKGYRDAILPPTYFYPLGVWQMKEERYETLVDGPAKFEKLKQDTLKPETIATHWWEGSWVLPDASL